MSLRPFINLLALPALVVLGYAMGGMWNFLLPGCCFLLHPLLNRYGKGDHGVTAVQAGIPGQKIAFRMVMLAFVPILLALTAWALFMVSTRPGSNMEFVGLVLSIGTLNGVLGFTIAHECIHRREWPDRMAGQLILLQNGYLHYALEHIRGHHVYGCTEMDPHTARFNESLYHFLARSVTMTWRNAWKIENRRMARKGYPPFDPRNRMIGQALIHLATYAMILYFTGWRGLVFLAGQSAVAIFLLHAVDYLQHYGLMRREMAPGKFERTQAMHAWATGDRIHQFNLFQLDKHADHHLHPSRTFEELTSHPDTPALPMGYAGMILLALYPKAWFTTVNPLIPPSIKMKS